MKTNLSDAELMRYARQIILPEWDITAQLKLVNSHVLVIGMGGLGCPVSQTLARAGVGFLRLVDFDVIEDSNLQRQQLFTVNDIGKNKAETAKNVLRQQNEFIHIEAITYKIDADNISQLFKDDIHLVIDCTDNFVIRDIINIACMQARLPLLSCSAIKQVGQLALYDFTNPKQACYRCVFPPTDGTDEEIRCADIGVMASTTQIMGNLTAHTALMFLGLNKNCLENKLLLWQGETMQQRLISYIKDKQCNICGNI